MMLEIDIRVFLKYKFFNSLFLGISVGSIFTIYSSLEPSIYSIGGIVLAICMLIVAKYYHKILNINSFYKISLSVELVLSFIILYFLTLSYSYSSALLMYVGYQVTFIFGSYLIRAETLFLKHKLILSYVDTTKQKGYLLGMFISFVFYKIMKYFNILDSKIQVYNIHFLLLFIQITIIFFLIKAFKKRFAIL